MTPDMQPARKDNDLPTLLEIDRWFEGKELTTDWLGAKLQAWLPVLAPLRPLPVSVLELGSYEGRSAIAFLELMPKSKITTVDFFPDAEIEARCRRNLAPYAERADVVKGWASGVIEELAQKKRRFDVIYVDAGKSAYGVLARSVMTWGMLKPNGIMIWDDLKWGADRPETERPGPGIEAFARLFESCMTVVHRRRQLIARKTADWPKAT